MAASAATPARRAATSRCEASVRARATACSAARAAAVAAAMAERTEASAVEASSGPCGDQGRAAGAAGLQQWSWAALLRASLMPDCAAAASRDRQASTVADDDSDETVAASSPRPCGTAMPRLSSGAYQPALRPRDWAIAAATALRSESHTPMSLPLSESCSPLAGVAPPAGRSRLRGWLCSVRSIAPAGSHAAPGENGWRWPLGRSAVHRLWAASRAKDAMVCTSSCGSGL